jgi:hypothetical protein
MAIVFWLGLIIGVTLIFWWMWRFAGKIENDIEQERQWDEYITNMWRVDPYQAQQLELQYGRIKR